MPARRRPTTYREQTYGSPHWMIRFAHRRRTEIAIELLTRSKPRIILDYGAGDGELPLHLLSHAGDGIEAVIALEPLEVMRRPLVERVRHEPRIVVVSSEQEAVEWLRGRRLDAVCCLGVLEHLSFDDRHSFYRLCDEHMAPGAPCMVDVPVESGASVLVKQFGRRVLKGRAREYSAGELARAVAGRPLLDPERSRRGVSGEYISSHKGFDHRAFERELRAWRPIVEKRNAPFRLLPWWLSTQDIFYVCRGPSAS